MVTVSLHTCSATKEATTSLNEPMRPTLDEALEYVVDDELVEVSSRAAHVEAAFCCRLKVDMLPSHVANSLGMFVL